MDVVVLFYFYSISRNLDFRIYAAILENSLGSSDKQRAWSSNTVINLEPLAFSALIDAWFAPIRNSLFAGGQFSRLGQLGDKSGRLLDAYSLEQNLVINELEAKATPNLKAAEYRKRHT